MKRYLVRPATTPRAWAGAVLLDDFTLPWDVAVSAPRTEFRALHDAERLYFRFDCEDRDLVLAAGDTAKQRVLGSDRVELFFAPTLELDPYFCLEMSPSGDVYAYQARHYRQFDDQAWSSGFELAATIDGSHYWVEGSLPLRTLRALGMLPGSTRELFVGVYRAEFSRLPDGSVHRGWMPWVDPLTTRPDFHVPASFGVFELA